MKKLFYSALIITAISGSFSTAASAAEVLEDTISKQQEKQPVELDKLPDAVRKEIASDKFVGWTPSSAFTVKSAIPYYEIVMIRGEEKKVVKLDEKGQQID